jgi:diguanylate cyclase (GGDEF)-like protein
MLAAADRVLAALPKPKVLALALLGVLLVGALDLLSGYEISLSLLYLVPVSLATWYSGRRSGVAIALLSSVAWFVADRAAGHLYSNQLIEFWNTLVRLGFFLVTAGLLGEVGRRLELEKQRARTDGMTGLLNGPAFIEQMDRALALARRDGAALTVAYIDLDDFKRINDRHGHVEGDRALRAVAHALSDGIRGADVAARLGGDEFALLLPHTDTAGAHEVIARFKRHIDAARGMQGPAIACSIGVVTFFEVPRDSSEAIRRADELMYEVKASGKNRVAFRGIGAAPAAPHSVATAAPPLRPG